MNYKSNMNKQGHNIIKISKFNNRISQNIKDSQLSYVIKILIILLLC
jgi:hypothetical protein